MPSSEIEYRIENEGRTGSWYLNNLFYNLEEAKKAFEHLKTQEGVRHPNMRLVKRETTVIEEIGKRS